jgi:hypothetical protein
MKKVKAKVMKIGDSFGIIMPKEVLDVDNIKERDESVIKGIEKARVEDMFGIGKGLPYFHMCRRIMNSGIFACFECRDFDRGSTFQR